MTAKLWIYQLSRALPILLLMLGFATTAHAASFDCSKTTAIVDRLICDDPVLSTLDDTLAIEYDSAQKKTQDPQSLLNQQRAWLQKRNACGSNSSCVANAYYERISQLANAQPKNAAPNRPAQNSSTNTPPPPTPTNTNTNTNTSIAVLDGNWYSPQWKYGYVLKNGSGVATSTNSPNFQVGQNIIRLTATSNNTFVGQQVYTDGKFYQVNAKLLADGRLYFEGDKNVKWVMERAGTASQTQVTKNVKADPVEACVSHKADLFRKEVGEGRLIRFDMLEEWRGECNRELKGDAKPPQPTASVSNAYSSPIRMNVELECLLKGTRFYRNGAIVNESKAPANTKPVFYKFNGQRLSVYYKERNAPEASGDGARFTGRKTVVDEGRTFEISQFEKLAAMHEKIEFFFEPSAQGIKQITLVSRFSDNGFASYGQYIFSCKE